MPRSLRVDPEEPGCRRRFRPSGTGRRHRLCKHDVGRDLEGGDRARAWGEGGGPHALASSDGWNVDGPPSARNVLEPVDVVGCRSGCRRYARACETAASVVSIPSTMNSSSDAAQPHQRLGARAAVHDQLADERIVIRWDRVAGIDGAIDPDTEAAGRDGNRRSFPGEGRKVSRVLGVDAALDRVAGEG